MNKKFISLFFQKMIQIRSKELIVSVPIELREQHEQQLLKNSLFRIKILCIVQTVIKLFYIFIHTKNNTLEQLPRTAYYEGYSLSIITILVLLLTKIFSKNNNRFMLWSICYLFIVYYFAYAGLNMFFIGTDYTIVYIFSVTLFLGMFMPDFKPKIFIFSAIIFYFTTVAILIYHHKIFRFQGPQEFIFFTFVAILIIKILYYNSKTYIFIDITRISALNEKLQTLSVTDELTKIDNRRSFLNYMDIIWKQSLRLKLPVNVLIIDIDYFKKYNDSLGHLEGDRALIAVAQCIKNQLKRETDFVARFGGEEFVVLLPFMEMEGATDFAEKLVQCIEDIKIPHPMSECSKYVTISAGMARIMPDINNSYTQLLDDADKALYVAKQLGRNRVEIK